MVNNAKVSDHHAILPTKEAMEKGMGGLSGGKKNLLMLIGQQLVQATGKSTFMSRQKFPYSAKNMNLLQRKAACADGLQRSGRSLSEILCKG